jgi:hypothetical protein
MNSSTPPSAHPAWKEDLYEIQQESTLLLEQVFGQALDRMELKWKDRIALLQRRHDMEHQHLHAQLAEAQDQLNETVKMYNGAAHEGGRRRAGWRRRAAAPCDRALPVAPDRARGPACTGAALLRLPRRRHHRQPAGRDGGAEGALAQERGAPQERAEEQQQPGGRAGAGPGQAPPHLAAAQPPNHPRQLHGACSILRRP